MKLIKKIFANPYVKKVLPSDPWVLAAVIAVAILLGLLIYLIIKRRKKAKDPAPEAKEKQDFLKPNSLVRVWKNFLRDVPVRFRRSILMYQPYIVMGEAGSGKSQLINNYSDWKNQANQFYPSRTQDDLLQIYLGSRVLVQEISAVLLHDISAPTRKALVNLWKRFRHKNNLTVVITLKGEDLIHKDPDEFKAQAQMLRGKVNVLSEIIRQPVKVKIALTFMNRVQGFSEFSAFMNKNQAPFEFDIKSQGDLKGLANLMAPYDAFISNALVSAPAKDYLNILAFYRKAPKLLAGLERFIHTFTDPEPLSVSPQICGVFFTDDSSLEDRPYSNPLQNQVSIKTVREYHPLRKHQWIAAGIAIAGTLFLAFSYTYKDRQVREMMDSLDRISFDAIKTGAPVSRDTCLAQAELLMLNMEKLSARKLDDRFIVDFFPDAKDRIDRRVARTRHSLQEQLIKRVFMPELVLLENRPDAHNKNLMLLGLIYASDTNQLGKLIENNLNLWCRICNLPETVISEYIRLNPRAWDRKISIQRFLKPAAGTAETIKNQSWVLFLKKIEKVINQTHVSPRNLARLQKQAASHWTEVEESLTADWFAKVSTLLSRETVLADDMQSLESSVSKNDLGRFQTFLAYFQGLAIVYPDVAHMTIAQLFERLEGMMAFKSPDKEEFQFRVNEQSWYFNSDDFTLLMTKSSMVQLLGEYVATHGRHPGLAFFQDREGYEDLVVDISSDDNFYFSKRTVIDGRYTRDVYDSEIKPILSELPALLDKLPVSRADKGHFSSFMSREVAAYINAYLSAYENYYKGFRIHADSVGELRYMLTQMSLPLSQFQEFLMVINDNISLDLGDNSYFSLIKNRMRPLRFISLLMQADKDQYPEFEKYKAILRQINEDLVAQDAPEEATEENGEDLQLLKSRLSAVGRISLDIFLDRPESYYKMVRKWSVSVGIPENWLYPFTEPVIQAYLIGREQIEKSVAGQWQTLSRTYIDPVLACFPFNPDSPTPVSLAAMTALASPNKDFWSRFSSGIRPFYKKGPDNKWKARTFDKGSLNLPGEIVPRINFISTLTRTFFDENGLPAPLYLSVKPEPLPPVEEDMLFVVLSYLRSGENTVFGFNQQPVWNKLKLPWWEELDASVGAEFMKKLDKPEKSYAQVSVPRSFFSFYRLLQKADTSEPGKWMWAIESPGEVPWKRAITFTIKQDPWAFFKPAE